MLWKAVIKLADLSSLYLKHRTNYAQSLKNRTNCKVSFLRDYPDKTQMGK
jgi:hypothetical protein